MRSSSEQINFSYTEDLSWTDESGSDHSLAESEVMLYSLLHHEQPDSTDPETILDITTSSRTKANRLDQVQYVIEQYNSMATKKSFTPNKFTRRNLSTFNRYTNKHSEMVPKNLEVNNKKNRTARLKTKRRRNRNITSVQSLLKEVYKLSADTSVNNVITLYDPTSPGPSTPLTSLSLNVSSSASKDCSFSARNNNSIQSDATEQSRPVRESLGADMQPEMCVNETSRKSRKDCPEIVVPSKYTMTLNSQRCKDPVIHPDIIILDSDNESIDSVIEVRPPTPPPPLVISIDSSDESSETTLGKDKSVSKSKHISSTGNTDQIMSTLNGSNRNVAAEPESDTISIEGTEVTVTETAAVTSEVTLPTVPNEGAPLSISSEDTAPPVSNKDPAPSVSNKDPVPPVCNEETAPPVSYEDHAVPVNNVDTAVPGPSTDSPVFVRQSARKKTPNGPLSTPRSWTKPPVSYVDPALPVNNVDTAVPGPSTDSPVFVRQSARKKTPNGPLSTPRSWTKRMTKFYCDSWGGHNFDHQKLISQMSDSPEKWIVRDVDFRPQLKNRRFCNRCKQRGHLQWECSEEKKVPVCFMCGESGHTAPWCPNKICLVCGRPSGAFLYGCLNCYLENKSCATCGERGHYAWQCPSAWRKYHATTAMGDGLVPEEFEDYREQYCCKCAKRGHSAFSCTEVPDRLLSKQVPRRSIMAKVGNNHNNWNNIRVGISSSKIIKTSNKQMKMNQRRNERAIRRKYGAKNRRRKRMQKKAENLAQPSVEHK